MKNVTKLVFLLLLSVLVFSCSSNEETGNGPLDNLEATTKGMLKAKIDGEPLSVEFESTKLSTNSGGINITKFLDRDKIALNLNVYNLEDKEGFAILDSEFTGAGTKGIYGSFGESIIATYFEKGTGDFYQTSNEEQATPYATVTISEFNLKSRTIKGTFSGTFQRKIDGEIVYKKVTDGEFSGTFLYTEL